MKRTPENLEEYKKTMMKVLERADNRCEVMVDKFGNACTELDKKRCLKYIPDDRATYTNFLHKSTRNGKSAEWVHDPDNIILGCSQHHYEEENTGIRVEACVYDKDELNYLPYED